MKWFGRWLINMAQKAQQEEREDKIYGHTMTSGNKVSMRHSHSDVDGEDGLNIVVRKAMGGKIVTFRTYDHKQDRNSYKLYVIPDEHEFEKELGKLITLESMRL